jgi:hypothetical protein
VRRRGGERYVRFVCFQTVAGQRTRLGLFQALDEARLSDQAADWALAAIRDLSDWFNAHLDAPTRFSRATWNGGEQQGLSWFKPSAHEHIQKMHELKTALENCGVHVEQLTTDDPGLILFEDAHQVVAEPGARRF